MRTTVEDEKLPNTAPAGITPLTNNNPIPPKKTRSEGNFVQTCSTKTNKTTNTTNHAARLKPNNIFLTINFKQFFYKEIL